MSIDVSVWVWKNGDASGSALLVLLALADISNHEGVCWPSVPTIATRTRLHEQTVRGHLQDLRDKGAIEVEPQPGRPNRYRILMPTPTETATPSDSRRGIETTQSTPTNSVPPGGTKPRIYEQSRTVIEPSTGTATPRGSRITEGWQASAALVSWAVESAPSVDVVQETANFLDYWLSRPGQRGVKLDWDRTWQTWMRRAHQWNVERGWVPVVAVAAPVSVPWWASTLKISPEDYLDNRDNPGWVESMQAIAAQRAS